MEHAGQPIGPGGFKPTRHSPLGIAAFVLSLASLAFLLLLILVSLVILWDLPEGAEATDNEYMAIGCVALLLLGLNLAAFGLGIAGVVQKNYKRILPALGLSVSIAIWLFCLIAALA
jgi:hypothetical protein